jgi:N-formylglutamate deformylase
VIPRVVANGKAIRLGKLTMTEANARLEQSYFPYHQALSALINAQHQRFGACFLFDIHSMPRAAFNTGFLPRLRPDIILGDRYGTSCDPWVSESVASIFRSAGFVVAQNAPFAGGYITQHYGAPRSGVHALQVEIDRGLYMDEKRIEPRSDFPEFVERISSVMQRLANLPPLVQRVAAE